MEHSIIEESDILEIFFKCEKINLGDSKELPNPRIILYKRNEKSEYVEVGRTEIKKGVQDTSFDTSVSIGFSFQATQLMKIILYHVAADGKESTEICRMDFELSKLISSVNSTMSFSIVDKAGKLKAKITLEAQKHVKEKFSYRIDLKCKDVKDLEWFAKADPCIRLYRPKPKFLKEEFPEKIPDEGWFKVHETECILNESNPDFKPFTITADKLCRCDENVRLKMEIWDYALDGDQKKKKIGAGYFKVKDAISRTTKYIKTTDENQRLAGFIIFEVFEKEKTFDFIDYLNWGLSLNQMILIDYSKSNGHPKEPDSLHALSSFKVNPYQHAISNVGSILFQYGGKTPVIRMHGFGGKLQGSSEETNSDYFVLKTQEIVEAKNMRQAAVVYERMIHSLESCFGAKLSPGIRGCMEWAKVESAKDQKFYAVLLILTDGEVEDMEETKEAIVEASVLPMSIIIVGLRGKNHAQFRVLDGDMRRLRDKRNRPVYRDIVQFVDYSQVKMDKAKLDEEVLAELPHQIVEYFAKKRIRPTSYE